MKKFFGMAAIAIVALAASCSKEDNPQPNTDEAIVKVTIEHSANFAEYDETLNIQVLGNESQTVNLNGIEWGEVNREQGVAAWFIRAGDITAQSRTLETSKKVRSVTVAGVITPKEYDVENATDLTTKITFFVDGKQVKSETVISTPTQISNFSIPIVVADY